MEEKTRKMDTTLSPADTQETIERQAAKGVSAASNDSFSHPKNYAKPRTKSQLRGRKRRNSSHLSLHKKINYLNFLKDLKQLITTDISTTCIYCDGFAESIARQRPSKHVPTHAPRNSTLEMLSSCPRTDSCYATHAQLACAR
jgi:hypothetical protein